MGYFPFPLAEQFKLRELCDLREIFSKIWYYDWGYIIIYILETYRGFTLSPNANSNINADIFCRNIRE